MTELVTSGSRRRKFPLVYVSSRTRPRHLPSKRKSEKPKPALTTLKSPTCLLTSRVKSSIRPFVVIIPFHHPNASSFPPISLSSQLLYSYQFLYFFTIYIETLQP